MEKSSASPLRTIQLLKPTISAKQEALVNSVTKWIAGSLSLTKRMTSQQAKVGARLARVVVRIKELLGSNDFE
jgi:hypothetical protein